MKINMMKKQIFGL